MAKFKKIDGPDFICIGAPKAGTTWIYERLVMEHPQVYHTWVKEINYFTEIYYKVNRSVFGRLFGKHRRNAWWRQVVKARLKKWRWYFMEKERFRWQVRFFFFPRTKRWYRSLFNFNHNQIAGDITPIYSVFDEDMVRKVKETTPDSKIIFIMRNPIERDWSHALMALGRFRRKSYAEVDKEELKAKLERYEPEGDYPRTIRIWEKFYKGQILYLFFDELKEDDHAFLKKICDFLEIDYTEEGINFKGNLNPNSKKMKDLPKEIPSPYREILIEKHRKNLETLTEVFNDRSVNYPKNWLDAINE